MEAVLEVTATKMESDIHVGGTILENIVVHLDVKVEDGFRVDAFLLHALEHALGAEISQEGVVKLYVPTTKRIQFLEFLAIRLYHIGKVLF